ncbi:hypothetical protein [Amycolatopsis magusensis]|uniref:hypothetical protein n=1 Tax=Amycolatopsis magusensis TaxID=882444 RepID=UPI0024A7B2C6|nr:hypothetical protein [Amycolatopsis magusensis]MDI5975714.1 hypothetical protein [Amycolatopsis magusensis]
MTDHEETVQASASLAERSRAADERKTAADAREESLNHQQQRLARAEGAVRTDAHRATRDQTKVDRETATSARAVKEVRREGPADS